MARLIALFLVILLLILEVVIAMKRENSESIAAEYDTIRRRSDICRLPKQSGNCRNRVTAWYFNHFLQKCLKFVYTCGGNQNRFYKKAHCEDYCIGLF